MHGDTCRNFSALSHRAEVGLIGAVRWNWKLIVYLFSQSVNQVSK